MVIGPDKLSITPHLVDFFPGWGCSLGLCGWGVSVAVVDRYLSKPSSSLSHDLLSA